MNRSKYDNSEIGETEQRIENGSVFEFSSKLSIGASGGWLFKTGNKHAIITQREISTNGNELDYQVFAGPTVTNEGTPITNITNRSMGDSQKLTAKAFSSPTATGGIPLPAVYMPGNEGQGNRSTSQFNQDGFIRILEPNTYYYARITNAGTESPANVSFYLMWAEVSPVVP